MDIGIAVKKIVTIPQKYALLKARVVFFLSQMKLPEQHKAVKLFQLGYVLIIEFPFRTICEP